MSYRCTANNKRGMIPRGRNQRRSRTRNSSATGTGSNQSRAVQVVRFQPSVFGFPDRLVTKVRYCDYYNVTNTAGAIAKQLWRWNSTFDPDQTGTGHQPLYRDTFATIYDHYAVISATAKVTVVNPDTDTTLLIGVVTDDDSSTSSTFQTLMEQSHGKSTTLTPLSGSHSEHTFVETWDCTKILGIDPFTSEEYKTAVGSNPTEESYLAFWQIPADGSSTVTTGVIVEIVQEVLWTELSTPSSS